MNLLPKENVRRSGSVMFMGRELMDLAPKEMRRLCGADIAMVFQDPMSSLNPVMTIGKQITESLRLHLGMSRSEAAGHRGDAAALGQHPRARPPLLRVPAPARRAACASA